MLVLPIIFFLKILVLNCLTYSKKKKTLSRTHTRLSRAGGRNHHPSVRSVRRSKFQIFRASKYQSPERWVGRPARAAAWPVVRPRSQSLHYTSSASSPLDSGRWALGAWAVASAASFGRLVGETKGTSRPAKRGGQENSCLSAVASFDWRPSPVHHRRSVSESAASPLDSTGQSPPAFPAKSDARAPRRRRRFGTPVRKMDRPPAVRLLVVTRRCFTDNPALPATLTTLHARGARTPARALVGNARPAGLKLFFFETSAGLN